jgi:uncharacterized membrane protein YdbT with pleckstrin-like domain
MPVQSITAPAGPPPPETAVWSASPSQWLNIGRFIEITIVCGIGVAVLSWFRGRMTRPAYAHYDTIAIIVVIAWTLLRLGSAYLRVASTKYELTDQRLLITTGVLGKQRREIELRRVQDFAVRQPFWLRLVGLGDLAVFTADRATGDIVLRALHDPKQMDAHIRQIVRTAQATAGTREVNVL